MGDAGTVGLPRSDLEQGLKRARRARTARRAGLVLLAAICAAALAGLLGPFETTATHTSDQGELQVTHPRVVRPGTNIEVSVQVKPANGSGLFGLAVDQSLVEDLHLDDITPLPEQQVSDGDRLVYVFRAIDREATVLLRGRVPPQSTFSPTESTIALADDSGSPSEGVTMKVWVLP